MHAFYYSARNQNCYSVEFSTSWEVLWLGNNFVASYSHRKFSKSWKIRLVFQTLGTLHPVQNM